MAKDFDISLEHCEVDDNGNIISNKIRSHGFKRNAVQTLQEYLAPHSFVGRCGWAVRNIHSLFDYIFTSPRQDANAGKTIQGWVKSSLDGDVLGGVPPQIHSISTSPLKVEMFVSYLFRSHIYSNTSSPNPNNIASPQCDMTMYNILAGTLLRFYPDFVQLVRSDPKGRYTG